MHTKYLTENLYMNLRTPSKTNFKCLTKIHQLSLKDIAVNTHFMPSPCYIHKMTSTKYVHF